MSDIQELIRRLRAPSQAGRAIRAEAADMLECLSVGFVEPEPSFKLRWHDDGARYTVSKPNIGDTDVFTADQLREAYAAGAAAQLSAEPFGWYDARFDFDHFVEQSNRPTDEGDPNPGDWHPLYIRKELP